MHLGRRTGWWPGNEDMVRGYSGANLLLIDEAARVLDALYAAVKADAGDERRQNVADVGSAWEAGFLL
jgi:hypothetical protein